MCGRFALTVDPADLQDAFPEFTFPGQFAPRFNIAPTQPVLVIPNDGTGKADFFVWGLIPSWAKDPSIGARMINARAETLAEKPSFRTAYRYRRCLILADGFFEWQTLTTNASQIGSKVKIPHYIRLKSGRPFAFAGLWEDWRQRMPDGSQVKSATIITTQPNELIARLHNRMPVILPPETYARWLEPSPRQPADLQGLLSPYPSEEMSVYPVSTLVNSPANDRPECITPAR
ncbi:MAG: SOS response-associated peptidase [Anaerolineales bacterium]|nr:SOS response-associated peptidase [Anaerolineales bacterium]